MLLHLLRHGVAEDAGPGTGHRDAPRALTSEGAARMRLAARGMAALGLEPDAVLTSPLTRCRQTADLVCEALGGRPRDDDRLRPGMGIDGIAEVLAEHPDARELLLCGHQPDLSRAIADLVGGAMVEMKKGSLAVLRVRAARQAGADLVALYPPRALRRLGAA